MRLGSQPSPQATTRCSTFFARPPSRTGGCGRCLCQHRGGTENCGRCGRRKKNLFHNNTPLSGVPPGRRDEREPRRNHPKTGQIRHFPVMPFGPATPPRSFGSATFPFNEREWPKSSRDQEFLRIRDNPLQGGASRTRTTHPGKSDRECGGNRVVDAWRLGSPDFAQPPTVPLLCGPVALVPRISRSRHLLAPFLSHHYEMPSSSPAITT